MTTASNDQRNLGLSRRNRKRPWIGLILAGGTGSRLHPLSVSTNKHLLPIYDKPMIFNALSTLMLAGLSDICIVSSPDSLEQLRKLLGTGSNFGITLKFKPQQKPLGVVDAILRSEINFMENNVAVILGDNIFYGADLQPKLRNICLNC